jgi:hypothetical protein
MQVFDDALRDPAERYLTVPVSRRVIKGSARLREDRFTARLA